MSLQIFSYNSYFFKLDLESGNIKVGAITFSTDVKNEFYLTEYNSRLEVINALRNIDYRGGKTFTADALEFVRTEAFGTTEANVRNVAIVITDGESNNRVETFTAARLTKTQGIHLISLGIGSTFTIHD